MEALQAQFHLIAALRTFFAEREFQDVLTPPMVENPGMEPHIHPFKVVGLNPDNIERSECYLHTSPEFHMKRLLSEGFEKIYTISYCFRDEPESPLHRPQFLMLEWYRSGKDYRAIMEDCKQLLKFLPGELTKRGVTIQWDKTREVTPFKPHYRTVSQIFQEAVRFDILNYLELEKLKEMILENFPSILPIGGIKGLEWDDYFFLLFLNYVEPHIARHYPVLILDEYPYHLSALSTIKESDPRVCQRFELYINGVEICNCFNELRDLKVQKERFKLQSEQKERLYGIKLPGPTVLYDALEKGLPKSAGVAMGVDRLLGVLTGTKNSFWR